MRPTEEPLRDLSNYQSTDGQFKKAQAEFQVYVAREYLALLEQTRETLGTVLSNLGTQIEIFREVNDHAAQDSARTSRLLVRWTKVLSLATIGLVIATGVLVYATVLAS